jgi:hypothetical protein
VESLNTNALREWSDELLAEYHRNIQKQLGRLSIFESQVQAEWDRRYPNK